MTVCLGCVVYYSLFVTVQVVPAPAGAQGPQAPAQPLFRPVVAAKPPQRAETKRLQEGQRPPAHST